MAKKNAVKQARMLRDEDVDGVRYAAGRLIEFDADQADALQANGAADTHPDAIAHALEQGAEVVSHVAAE